MVIKHVGHITQVLLYKYIIIYLTVYCVLYIVPLETFQLQPNTFDNYQQQKDDHGSNTLVSVLQPWCKPKIKVYYMDMWCTIRMFTCMSDQITVVHGSCVQAKCFLSERKFSKYMYILYCTCNKQSAEKNYF